MQPQIANLSAYRQRKIREKNKSKAEEVLGYLYYEVLKKMADENQHIHPDELEAFFIEVITDHLMKDMELTRDRNRVMDHYRDFDQQLRDSLGHRLFTYQSLF